MGPLAHSLPLCLDKTIRTLHIAAACGPSNVFNGIDRRNSLDVMVALITGDPVPDPTAISVMKVTGGTWQNRVQWLKQRQAYGIWGLYDDDPDYGDTPADLDQRLRRAFGGWGIGITIRHPDGTFYRQGTLVQAQLDDHLARTGKLN